MKSTLLLLLMSAAMQSIAQSGMYIGAGFNVGFAAQIDSAGFKGPYTPKSLGIAGTTGYRLNHWIAEINVQHTGALIASFTLGRVLPVSETVYFEILAGIADNIIISKHPLQFTHRFSYNATGRLQVRDFYLQCSQIQNNTYVGIGFKGFANLTTY